MQLKSQRKKGEGSGGAKLRKYEQKTPTTPQRETPKHADETPKQYHDSVEAEKKTAETTGTTVKEGELRKATEQEKAVPLVVAPGKEQEYLIQQENKTATVSPHTLGSNVTERTSITSQPKTDVRNVSENVTLPTEKTPLTKEIDMRITNILQRNQLTKNDVKISKFSKKSVKVGQAVTEKSEQFAEAAPIMYPNDPIKGVILPKVVKSGAGITEMVARVPMGAEVAIQKPGLLPDAMTLAALGAASYTAKTAVSDPLQLASDVAVFSVLGAGIGKVKIPKISETGLRAFAESETAAANYWQVKYDFSKPRVNALESEIPQIKPGEGLVSGKQISGLNPVLEAKIRAMEPLPEGFKPFSEMSALERYQASKNNIPKAPQITETKLIESTTIQTVDKALAESETAAANYWQVKYDFSKPRVNALEAEVPQINVGEGLVSGKKISGINPLLEMKIKAMEQPTGLKPFAEMSALEKYHASKSNVIKPIPKAETPTPQPVDTVFLNKLLSGEKVTPPSIPTAEKPTHLKMPEIEQTNKKLVGIKKYSDKPLSEVPDSFFEPPVYSAEMWQGKYRFEQGKPEQSAIPQLLKEQKPKTVRKTALKESSSLMDVLPGEKAFLEKLINTEPAPNVKISVKTTPKGKPLLAVVPQVGTKPQSKTKTEAFVLPDIMTIPDVSVITAVGTFTKPITSTGTKVKPLPEVKPETKTKTETLLDLEIPEITIKPLKPTLDYDTGSKKKKTKKKGKTSFDVDRLLNDWKDPTKLNVRL